MKQKNKKTKIYHHFIGQLQAFKKSLIFDAPFFGTLALTLISISGLITSFIEKKNIPIVIVVVISSLAGAILCLAYQFHEYISKKNLLFSLDRKDYEKDILEAINIDTSYCNDGYHYEKIANTSIIRSDLIDGFLLNNSNLITLKKGKSYIIPIDLRFLISTALKKNFENQRVIYNQRKIRLNEDIFLNSKCLSIGKTDYYSSLTTNELCFSIIRSNYSFSQKFNGKTLLLDDYNHLYSLKNSPCSNHIGISTLAFSNDGYALILKQGYKNNSQPGKYITSASGSLDYRDKKGCKTLSNLIIKGMERELREECNLPKSSKKCSIKTYIIGYCRILNRGGKPEFFGISFIDLSKKQIVESFSSYKNKEKKKELISQLYAVKPLFYDSKSLFDEINKLVKNEFITMQLRIYEKILNKNVNDIIKATINHNEK